MTRFQLIWARYWWLALMLSILVPLCVGIYILYRTPQEVDQGNVLKEKEKEAIIEQLEDEVDKREQAEQIADTAKVKWVKAEQKAIIHEQRADSILNNKTNEAAAAATLSAPGGVQRYLATYRPKAYRAGSGSRDTLR